MQKIFKFLYANIYSVTMIFSLLLVLGLTFAWFLNSHEASTNDIVLSSNPILDGEVYIWQDNKWILSKNITSNDFLPGDSFYYLFKVNNTSNKDVNYSLKPLTIINTYVAFNKDDEEIEETIFFIDSNKYDQSTATTEEEKIKESIIYLTDALNFYSYSTTSNTLSKNVNPNTLEKKTNNKIDFKYDQTLNNYSLNGEMFNKSNPICNANSSSYFILEIYFNPDSSTFYSRDQEKENIFLNNKEYIFQKKTVLGNSNVYKNKRFYIQNFILN